MEKHFPIFALLSIASLVANAQQWTFQSGKQTNNGSVTVKSTTGSTQTAIQNPTGAAAKVNQTAVTQAPLVVTQATATLPVVVEGTACNSATQQLGVKADLSIGYGCQANVWVRLNYIPTVVEGAGCGGYDKFGMTAGNAKQMACQGGVWKIPAGGGIVTGGGRAQLWKALAGQTISCSDGAGVAYASVDSGGVPYIRLIYASLDSGYLARESYTINTGATQYTASISMVGVKITTFSTGGFDPNTGSMNPSVTSVACTANWS